MNISRVALILLFAIAFNFAKDDLIDTKMEYQKWEQMDLEIIQDFFERIEPLDSLNYKEWEKELNTSDNLGFGFTKREGSITGGTTSIRINFIYKGNEFYTGRFSIQRPSEPDSVPLLAEQLEKQFLIKDEYQYYYYLNRKNSHTPLKVIDNTFPVSMRLLIEPFNSMAYGFKGGFVNNILGGRKLFHKITRDATPKNFKQLLYSLNPTVRLMVNRPGFSGDYL